MSCSKQEKTRLVSSKFSSESNSAQSLATISSRMFSRPNLGKKKNKRFHCTCPLHGKSLEQCEMLYILEIYQPDLVHLKITESLPQALLGFGLGYVF